MRTLIFAQMGILKTWNFWIKNEKNLLTKYAVRVIIIQLEDIPRCLSWL